MKTTLEQISVERSDIENAVVFQLGVAAITNSRPRPELNLQQQSESPDNLYAPKLDKDPVVEIKELKGSEGIFNVTVLNVGDAKYLLGRRVINAAPAGQPDVGPLIMAALDSNGDIAFFNEVWNPKDKDVLIEDPRALQTTDGTTIIGITAVDKLKGNKTCPGILKLKSPEQLLAGYFPEPLIFETFNGDQTTPINREIQGKNTTSLDDNLIMYRPEGLNHTLHVLDYSSDNPIHFGFIDFPKDIPYALYKIGTTTSPKWLNDYEAFFVFHGINKTIDGLVVPGDTEADNIIYVYSIGTARLVRFKDESGKESFKIDNISSSSIIDPDSLPELTDGRQVELHPDIRRALYCCGDEEIRNSEGQLIRDKLFVSQGDKRMDLVVIAADEIMANWNRNI